VEIVKASYVIVALNLYCDFVHGVAYTIGGLFYPQEHSLL
jgi:hypothetical protein